MGKSMGEFLIQSTAILSVACYAGRTLIDVSGGIHESRQRSARWLWTIGCVAMIAHMTCAFQFQHSWSRAEAWEHTRQRTRELTGWNSGAGLYANEAMTALWLIDVIIWWISQDWPRRQRVWYWTVQIVFAFMMVNATAVFGPWYWWPLAIGFGVVLMAMRSRRRRD